MFALAAYTLNFCCDIYNAFDAFSQKIHVTMSIEKSDHYRRLLLEVESIGI